MDGAEHGAFNDGSSFWWAPSNATVVTRDTTTKRSGNASYACNSGAGNSAAYCLGPSFAGLTAPVYMRAYILTSAAPSSQVGIFGTPGTIGSPVTVAMSTSGTLQFVVNTVNQGSATAAVNDGTWHRLELSVTQSAYPTGTLTAAEFRLDGISVATFSGSLASASAGWSVGWFQAPGASKQMNVDDLVINDSAGSSQNTWPGDSSIVLLVPISDNARGSNWVGGAGGTTSLFDAVNNTPPIGVATGSGTNLSQIHNVTKDTTGNYDANMTSYTAAGIGPNDVINIVWPYWYLAGAATGDAFLLVSNPQANGGTESIWGATSTAGTFLSGWLFQSPAAQRPAPAPSVTKGTSPVMRVGKRVSSTNEMACCAMGIYVDYTPTIPRSLPPVAHAAQQKRQMTRWY